ncbi:MAG TPA: RNA polymerase sigma factor WhiG [Spirochaetota bacterium]|jgi:RNA polymerase sigma factor for flagellar operon FliA|nr:RNA polymerase sigma factor WhiG [Spirochaetota bacterium]OQA98922.1 MAG: RNA polymerase sigma factor FliA [Spirochaetes bacterium ADurb.Bin218]HOK03055.1 RNA polymerase sigma factor WhiG [Spirochaetota bacterium]HOK92427.1 RNA polymerase sigma factor WhiG [Spirochaetota bacterium]HON16931.1 RNA polymerase sigma factor WhiG [Spirochaetota bacterium]
MDNKKFKEYDSIDEDKLWERYSKSNEQSIRDYFVLKYAPLVKYVAGKISMGMPQSIEFEDLVSYGIFGLLDAINKFDPSRGIKFKTYAMTRIRGAIFDELRSIDWIPRSIRQKAKQIEQVIAELENKLGRTVEDEEIAKELGITNEEFQNLLNKLSGTSMLSLNDVWYLGDDNDELSILETLEAPENMNPDILLEKEEIKEYIIDAIKKLPDKEKKVIVLYYYEDLTLKEIGEVLDVTESRVSQLHTKAIMRLRGRLGRIKSNIVG